MFNLIALLFTQNIKLIKNNCCTMYKGDFVDVRTLTPVVRLVDLHTLVCDGYNDGQEGEEGHLEGGVDV